MVGTGFKRTVTPGFFIGVKDPQQMEGEKRTY